MSTPALAFGPATTCADDTSGGSSPAAGGSAVGCEDDGFDESSTFIVGGMIRCDMKAGKMGHHWKKYLGTCEGRPNNESDDGLPVTKLRSASLADGSEDGNKEMSSFGAFLFGVLLGCLEESRMALSFLFFLLFLSLLRALFY
ncbi:hypothetical protein FRACYDRAFT_255551 [Fragilariopsis cylindrus CCMP1102]|uniref:Uncharacterized protein n=1 Tax=Fragilariopsis cylindrus CCMP1102 TaxID=635003 RepID=A0A1E7EK14_9STRA|nr:hypothetical protein FRACYDRAFT_255551 [Fragilariopsis cylindrus CCMP1102]|eukprot:OEU06218.1 hypothetical protein FRACYDRAFT_255551 [Fragilariopsis cylindrus CCMP1102]